MTTREKVLAAFHDPCGYYHQEPHVQRNYIDGMFHVGMLAYAADLAGDLEIQIEAECYIRILAANSIRAYGPEKLSDDWKRMDDYWDAPIVYGHTKPQSFAGPVAMWMADPMVAELFDVPKPDTKAKLLTIIGRILPWIFLHDPFKQHLNSLMLSYLYLGKRPPSALKRITVNNPVYAYIFGEKLEAYEQYPTFLSAWPAKNMYWYDGTWTGSKQYTPTCQLVGDMLQESMEDQS